MLDVLQQSADSPWRAALEILILAVAIYLGYAQIRETRAARLVVAAVLILVGIAVLSSVLQLEVLGWLLRGVTAVLVLVLVVIFQPELRRAIGDIGTHGFFSGGKQKREFVERMDEVVRKLSSKRFGALFAIERRMELGPYLETGVEIDAAFSDELILTIFHPKTMLHDGGMILRGDTIVGAGCVFPVSQREMMDRSIGLRHRAGMGITEETDAIAIVVSEETGSIAICHRGQIERDLDSEQFSSLLAELLDVDTKKDDEEEETRERDRERPRTTDGSATAKLEG